MVEIREVENKIAIIGETKSWFFEKINRIDELLGKWTKKRILKLLKSEVKIGCSVWQHTDQN